MSKTGNTVSSNQGDGGTLKTLALLTVERKKRWVETIIDIDKILYVSECPLDDYPGTCMLSYNDHHALHVDVPLKQMRKIIGEHKKYPWKNFDTHFDTHCDVQ
jgi:hypothetical protein